MGSWNARSGGGGVNSLGDVGEVGEFTQRERVAHPYAAVQDCPAARLEQKGACCVDIRPVLTVIRRDDDGADATYRDQRDGAARVLLEELAAVAAVVVAQAADIGLLGELEFLVHPEEPKVAG